MKKIICLIIYFLCFINLWNPKVISASSSLYARILSEDVYLYRSTNQDSTYANIFCEIEKSYFVEILDEQDNFFKAKYFNLTGYVLKDEVDKVYKTPQNPYPSNITFNVYSSLGAKIRTSPEASLGETNIIGIIPSTDSVIDYYGKINGEECLKGQGKEWLYCAYSYDNIGNIVGYIYAPLTENLPEIYPNTETFSAQETTSTPSILASSTKSLNLGLVLLLLIPAILFIVMLFIPSRPRKIPISRTKTQMPNNVKMFKKSKQDSKLDYYEID